MRSYKYKQTKKILECNGICTDIDNKTNILLCLRKYQSNPDTTTLWWSHSTFSSHIIHTLTLSLLSYTEFFFTQKIWTWSSDIFGIYVQILVSMEDAQAARQCIWWIYGICVVVKYTHTHTLDSGSERVST